MTNATFFNFTDRAFTGYWNGKPKTVKAGEKIYMPAWLAEHFAKHLTNRELILSGKEVYVSPKTPGQVPEFMDVFRKAFIADAPKKEGESGELDEIIASTQIPSMDIQVVKAKPIDQGPAAALAAETAEAQESKGSQESDPYDAHAGQVLGPGKGSTIINAPDDGTDDESGFDHGAQG